MIKEEVDAKARLAKVEELLAVALLVHKQMQNSSLNTTTSGSGDDIITGNETRSMHGRTHISQSTGNSNTSTPLTTNTSVSAHPSRNDTPDISNNSPKPPHHHQHNYHHKNYSHTTHSSSSSTSANTSTYTNAIAYGYTHHEHDKGVMPYFASTSTVASTNASSLETH